MDRTDFTRLEERLVSVLGELKGQPQVARSYPPNTLSYADEMTQLGEFIDVGEFGLAYELVVAALETKPFALTGAAAVALLELGLLFGFKTDSPEDAEFDRRHSGPL
ncbi:MAG TPA: hypothetical protein VHY91_16145 [Pirellulales bacterium]|jgi:hypothetical protein|nr:hypothetical protein [Pirellulales bacterium]